VYLDTVRPAQAEGLLEQALRLSDGLEDRSAQARLLELLAENKLNMGRATEAEDLRVQAQRLRDEGPSEDTLSVRVKLRTGQLAQARTILEAWAEQERDQLHAPRAVRETLLLLSLIHAMQGSADASYAAARDGIALGNRFDSPFVTAIGLTRLGHAEQVRGELTAAQEAYHSAIRLADQRALPRLRAEIMWGLTRVYGYNGDLASAQRMAAEGIQVARSAGDEWVVALVQLALGASHTLARQDDASIAILNDALAAFRACGDRFGRAVTHLWLALAHSHLKQHERALAHLDEALALGANEQYDYLFTTRTLHGWHDPRVGVPLLLRARKRGLHSAYVNRLLSTMGLEQVTAHPGYQLHVQTLGVFRVWRGNIENPSSEVRSHEWQRRKARQLLQLLITYRGRMLEREEIFELLWANETPDAMARDFKVALNQVNRVLEPERAMDETTAFVERVGTAYGFRAGADVWIDADEFARRIAQAETARDNDALDLYRRALALYQDDYLIADARYEAWASAERERLLGLYLRAADRLAAELFARGAYKECLAWCEKILARDRCWEHAYRLMMRAHAARGEHVQARRVFEQCAQALQNDLEVEPSPATIQVFRETTRGEA
jgi:two-component SAPR family response regulator